MTDYIYLFGCLMFAFSYMFMLIYVRHLQVRLELLENFIEDVCKIVVKEV